MLIGIPGSPNSKALPARISHLARQSKQDWKPKKIYDLLRVRMGAVKEIGWTAQPFQYNPYLNAYGSQGQVMHGSL